MKKFVLIIVLSVCSFASVQHVEQEIYDKIFSSIFAGKKVVKIWIDDENDFYNLKSKRFVFVKKPEQADILIVNHSKDIVSNKPIFVRKYYLLKKYKNRAIGGFYWQKGRPNIIFLKSNLLKYNIHLPNDLNLYIEKNS